MPLRVTITPGSEPTKSEGVAGRAEARMTLSHPGLEGVADIGKGASLDGLHHEDGNAALYQSIVKGLGCGLFALGRAGIAVDLLPVDIVELDLDEIPLRSIEDLGQRSVVAVERESQMLDAAGSLLLLEVVEHAVVEETRLKLGVRGNGMAEEEIDIVHLEVLERALEHLLGAVEGRRIAGAEGEVGHLGGYHI